MSLTTEQLQALAQIYGATPTQLQASPADADMVAALDRAQSVIQSLSPEMLDHWLAMGEALKR